MSEVGGHTEPGDAGDDRIAAEAFALAAERYQVERELARKPSTRTLAARDAVMRRDVALVESLGPDGDDAVRREGRALARLAHPAIVPLYDAGERAGRPFFARKLVAGRPLHEVVADAQTFGVRASLLPAMIGVAEALAHAHATGVVHGDVEPANVLVGVHGETVLVDWSHAVWLEEPRPALDPSAGPPPRVDPGATAPSRADPLVAGDGPTVAAEPSVGKARAPAFAAPEVLRGDAVDARSDVYAAGALLYFLLSGVAPYDEGLARASLVRHVLDGPPPPLTAIAPEVPGDLAAIVAMAMARDPARRYANAGELAADLARFQAGRLVSARPLSPLSRAHRWIARHRVLAGALGAAAVAAAIAYAAIPDRRARAIAGCRERAGDAVDAVWSDAARDRVARRFDAVAARVPGATALGLAALAELDAHTAAIREGLADACTARIAEPSGGGPSEQARACHERALREVAAVVGVLGEAAPGEAGIDRPRFAAPDALSHALDGPVRCSPELLARLPPEPTDATRRTALEDVRARLPRARATAALHLPPDGELRELVALARRSGYAPAIAETLWVDATARAITATAELHEAARVADAARDDFRRARIMTSIVDETRPVSGVEEVELLPRASSAVVRVRDPAMHRLLDRALRRRAERITALAPAVPLPVYAAGDLVDVEWRGRWYPARILRVLAPDRYRVSYDGYGSSWDETVTPDRIAHRRPRASGSAAGSAGSAAAPGGGR